MASRRDKKTIIDFLKSKRFYDYTNLSVCFQDDLAIISKKGKVILKDKTSLLKSPNGSGGVFKTILRYSLRKNCKINLILS